MTLALDPSAEPSAPAVPPLSDLVARDAREFAVYARTGGWAFALMVARSVRPAAEAYDTMRSLVAEAVEADPCLRVQERRTKFYSSLQKATRAFEELTFDDAQDFYEDDMVQRLEELQQAIGSCLAALRGARGEQESRRNQSHG